MLILKTIEAGDSISSFNIGNKAVEIMTGAKMPKGYDAVIPIEKANIVKDENGNRHIIIDEAISAKTNVRYIGEDFRVGDKIIESGELIIPNHIMSLTANGF